MVEPEVIRGAAEGALLGSYRFVKVSGEQPSAKVASITVVSSSAKPEAKRAIDAARIVATAVCLARDWVNTPANALYPETFADAARGAVKGTRIEVEVLDEKALARGGPMLTKQYAAAQGGDVLLDWSALPTHLDEEQRLSRLTAWVLRADQDGRRYGLLLPQTHIAPELGRDHRDRCLRELALFGIAPEDRA